MSSENRKEQKKVRDVDRIRWKPSYPCLTNTDMNIGMNEIVERFKCKDGKPDARAWEYLHSRVHAAVLVSNGLIRNMMKPLEL